MYAANLISIALLLVWSLLSRPLLAVDTDHDTLPDDWEIANGRDPNQADYLLSTGGSSNCVLDDNGVVCWGSIGPGLTNVPSLSNPTQVSASYATACAVDDSGVVCWGDHEQSAVPALADPSQVSVGIEKNAVSF
jgi:hypothetical protein